MKLPLYTVTSIKQLDEKLIKQWQELWDAGGNANLFNSYEWFLTICKTNNLQDYEIFACYQNEELVAILPLAKYRIFGVTVFGSIDKENIVDTGFLVKSFDKRLLKTFFDEVFSNRNIYLQKVDSKAIKVVHSLYPKALYSLISVNPVINLQQDPFAHASVSMIQQVKRIIRKNEGKIQFKSYRTNLDKHLKTVFSIQKKSSKNARSMDIFANPHIKKYYQNLTKYCKKIICINILYFENTPIAYEYGSIYKNHYAGDQISFLLEYKKLSPGRLLIYHLFNYLKQENIVDTDMGGGISSYKMSFTEDYRLLYNIYYSSNPLTMYWWTGINKIRRFKQIKFPKKHTRDHEFLFKTF